ncbi:MAG: hypothetical protein COT33_01770 [Candidatus Nealsonbacteria bacterium CG08_land_8_20_14_0_20_38_20]|uniref:Uncharacterized protein n=1 Tax=Candidatus Nealsonbacteria bacterium CG08_land_8_20_14_0_20_38_20 TaxID=1974705 RepID=A0A2H0YLV4_9BACT|nr:MAG: hypothetical protein COT33_01770 [Candidatus Nealsonbacteria bacterium CG08_land_8_20_14_0_20_38_20]
MNKNIIIVVLVVLLIASIGWVLSLQQGKAKLQGQIKTLESEKTVLQTKIDKGLVYAKSLDLLFEPVRRQAGIPIRQNLSEEEWLLGLIEATKATADSKLQNNLNDIKKGGDTASIATVLFMEHAVSAIVDTFK